MSTTQKPEDIFGNYADKLTMPHHEAGVIHYQPVLKDALSETAAKRKQKLTEEAGMLRGMFSEPWDERFNVRIWDAVFGIDTGEIVVAMLVQRADSVPNLPKFQASVTPRSGDESSEVKNFADSDATPEMLAYFMRLDRVLDDHRPVWVMRTQTASHKLAVVRGNMSDRRLH